MIPVRIEYGCIRYREQGSKLYRAPLLTYKLVRKGFGNDTVGMIESMRSDEVIVNIAQDKMQHQMKQATMPNKQNVLVAATLQ